MQASYGPGGRDFIVGVFLVDGAFQRNGPFYEFGAFTFVYITCGIFGSGALLDVGPFHQFGGFSCAIGFFDVSSRQLSTR